MNSNTFTGFPTYGTTNSLVIRYETDQRRSDPPAAATVARQPKPNTPAAPAFARVAD